MVAAQREIDDEMAVQRADEVWRRVRHIVSSAPLAKPTLLRTATITYDQVDDPTHRACIAIANALIAELSRSAPLATSTLHLVATAALGMAAHIAIITPFFT